MTVANFAVNKPILRRYCEKSNPSTPINKKSEKVICQVNPCGTPFSPEWRCKLERDSASSRLSHVLIYDECLINDQWPLYTGDKLAKRANADKEGFDSTDTTNAIVNTNGYEMFIRRNIVIVFVFSSDYFSYLHLDNTV